ncbi:MAG: hypothetical protein J0M12_11380 [Deltaproteobacteria bacterium]|nr:hypothetical protein [Deltaproteobacteria bacterium]
MRSGPLYRRLASAGLVLSLLAVTGCSVDRTVMHQLPDTERQHDAQVNRARFTGENSGDMVTLDRGHVYTAISYLDGFPDKGPGQKHEDLAFRQRFLQSFADRDTDVLARLSDQSGLVRVNPVEISVLTKHLDLRIKINRAWVAMNEPQSNPDFVLRNLPQPKPWSVRTPLQQRGLGSSNFELIKLARIYQMNYSGLTGMMVKEAGKQGKSQAAYWALEAQEADVVVALVTCDAMALRRGEVVTDIRCAATYDMVDAGRYLLAARAAEAYGPIRAARQELSPAQAQQLMGSSWTDAEALARFRGWWNYSIQGSGRKGWLNNQVEASPDVLAAIWWNFRCIPPEMFSGSGQTLPEPVPMPWDSDKLAGMYAALELPSDAPVQPGAAEQVQQQAAPVAQASE